MTPLQVDIAFPLFQVRAHSLLYRNDFFFLNIYHPFYVTTVVLRQEREFDFDDSIQHTRHHFD